MEKIHATPRKRGRPAKAAGDYRETRESLCRAGVAAFEIADLGQGPLGDGLAGDAQDLPRPCSTTIRPGEGGIDTPAMAVRRIGKADDGFDARARQTQEAKGAGGEIALPGVTTRKCILRTLRENLS